MSVGIEDSFNIKESGLLGVLAGYINGSSEQIPVANLPSLAHNDDEKSGFSPVRRRNHRITLGSRSSTPELDASALPDLLPPAKEQKYHKVSNFDIGLKIINDLTGKDKVAKVLLYSLRIITVYALRFGKAFPGEILKDSTKYRLIIELIRSPRILLGFISKLFLKKSQGVMDGLSLYRQLLRFGKTPFRLNSLIRNVSKDLKLLKGAPTTEQIALSLYQSWFTEKRLGDLINIYYGICDELLVLYKMKVLSNKPLRQWAGKHECYSWYLDILLGLKQNYCKLMKLNERENTIKLNQLVRIKARQVIRNLKLENSNSSSPIRRTLTTDKMDAELQSIQKEKRIVVLSLIGLMCDFCFDSIDIFNFKVDRKLYLSFGLVSGFLGLSKVYIKFREEEEEDE